MTAESGLLKQARDAAVRRLLLESVVACRGNVSAAARFLGIDRKYAHALLRRHGISAEQARAIRRELRWPKRGRPRSPAAIMEGLEAMETHVHTH